MEGLRRFTEPTDQVLTERTITARLSGLLADLELDQPKIIGLNEIASRARSRGLAVSTRSLVSRLVKRGWLVPLRTKGMYEFVPAARAGAISSGDPFVELRATLQRRPNLPAAIAEDSAAWLHGLSTRSPDPQVIALPPSVASPQALSDFRTVHIATYLPSLTMDGLPVWRVETLLVMMAARPAAFGDWNNVPDWLPNAIDRSNAALIDDELRDQPTAVLARLAYLFDRADRTDHMSTQLREARRPEGPVYLGSARDGHYAPRFNVVDSLLPKASSRADANY